MKKVFGLFLAIVIVLGATAFAQTLSPDKSVDGLVKDVAHSRGINESDITGVNQVNFSDLPQEVNIKNIDKTNLAMYQVNVKGQKPVYVITASSQLFQNTIKQYAQRMLLTFGWSTSLSSPNFLNTAAGVSTDTNRGYVMPRDGAITGLTTNLNIVTRKTNDPIEVIIYKDGKEVGFRNEFHTNETGVQSDYDTMSGDILNFNKGDILSVKVIVPEGTTVKDITTLLEVQTN